MHHLRLFLLLALTTCALGQSQALLDTLPFKAGDESARIYLISTI
jgi:hypothetical protein